MTARKQGRKGETMSSVKEFLQEQLQDPEFAKQYEQVDKEMDFALALAQRREELGLTQHSLAALTGIQQPMIARIERGQMPTAPTLQRLAKGLRTGILFTDNGVMLVPVANKSRRTSRKKKLLSTTTKRGVKRAIKK
jgi:transcriptional regulator with XRE-family HTH domain